MEYDIDYLLKNIRMLMTKERYKHTVGTTHTAVSLAMLNYCNPEKAEIAAILHDCGKYLDYKKYIHKYNIKLTEFEKKCPSLIHAKIGAEFAKDEFGIKDADIINAIQYHTTGRVGMSVLEKIIYIADHIEPTRGDGDTLLKLRRVVFNNLELGLIMCLEDRLMYLNKKKLDIDEVTLETYEYYKEKYYS